MVTPTRRLGRFGDQGAGNHRARIPGAPVSFGDGAADETKLPPLLHDVCGNGSALVGGTLPAVAIEHEYLVTEDIPAIARLKTELPMLWDMGVPLYTRADRNGLIVSCYEDFPLFFGIELLHVVCKSRLSPRMLRRDPIRP